MLTVKRAPELRATCSETYWIGDPAIDRDASDVASWTATADPAALVVHPGQAPSKITWRPLTETEVLELTSDPGHALTRLLDAFRLGLVSIEGVSLERRVIRGRGWIDQRDVDGLMALEAPIPNYLAMRAWVSVDPAFPGVEWRLDGEVRTPLPIWLGAMILAGTFRGRPG